MTKEDLKDLIIVLRDFLRGDANTFLWAKSRKDLLSDSRNFEGSIYSIGGGNFFIALASMCLLSFLAKIYKILISKEGKLNSLFDKRGVFKYETTAVKEFIQKLKEENITIVDDKSIKEKKFWQLLRHGLVHLFVPKGNSSIQAIDPAHFATGLSLFQYKNHLNNNELPAITQNERGGFNCDADLLAIKVQKAADWLICQIDADPSKFSGKRISAIDKLFSAENN